MDCVSLSLKDISLVTDKQTIWNEADRSPEKKEYPQEKESLEQQTKETQTKHI